MTTRFRPPPLAEFYMAITDDRAAALNKAREEGYAEGLANGMRRGHAAGLAEGEARTRDAMLPELDALQENSAKRDWYESVALTLRRLLQARESDLTALENSVREVAAASLGTLFPVLLSRAAGAEIAALVGDALAERAPEILTLRAHPDTLAAVAAETGEMASTGRLMLVPDPRRAFGAVEAAWVGGGMTFDPAALLSHVTAALAPAGAAVVPAESAAAQPASESFPAPDAGKAPDAAAESPPSGVASQATSISISPGLKETS
jgi:hypothetical protein